MIMFAKELTDNDVKAAAEYFSSIKQTVWTKFVETVSVPKTYVGEGNMRFVSAGAREPLGRRIIEVPQEKKAPRFATRMRPLSLMCRQAVSRRERRSRQPAETAKPSNAASVMARTTRAWAMCRDWPAAARFISSASSTTSSMERGKATPWR